MIICQLVFIVCRIQISIFLGKTTEMTVTQGYAEIGTILHVALEGTAIIVSGRIDLSSVFHQGSYVGIVDGHSVKTAQRGLSFEGFAERSHGQGIVAHGKKDIAKAVQRHHPVLQHH